MAVVRLIAILVIAISWQPSAIAERAPRASAAQSSRTQRQAPRNRAATRQVRPPQARQQAQAAGRLARTRLRGQQVKEVRLGSIPTGIAPLGAIPKQGIFQFTVEKGTVNIKVVARGSETKGPASTILAGKITKAAGKKKIERINVYDVVNKPTLDALQKGTPFLEAPGVGRMTAKTIDRLGLDVTRIEVNGVGPKLNVYLQVKARPATTTLPN
jgi:hypothetical protein